jgi:hypothetical protein
MVSKSAHQAIATAAHLPPELGQQHGAIALFELLGRLVKWKHPQNLSGRKRLPLTHARRHATPVIVASLAAASIRKS